MRPLIIVMFLCITSCAQSRALVDTTVCSIAAHPSKFHNKNVRIRATASSGMEASILIDSTDGEWNKACGRINLDFHSARGDESTSRFLRLFGEQVSRPECDKDKAITQGMAHVLDPSTPVPAPCFSFLCIHCPRYRIVATFTGKLRYSERERHARFGHLGMFNLQLDMATASNLEVTDAETTSKR